MTGFVISSLMFFQEAMNQKINSFFNAFTYN